MNRINLQDLKLFRWLLGVYIYLRLNWSLLVTAWNALIIAV